MKSPFSIVFGKIPGSEILRIDQIERIYESFAEEDDGCPAYIFTGVRGCGKTVAMSTVVNKIRKLKDWIVVDLNPERDIISSVAAELSNHSIINEAKLNLSFLGLGLEIKGEAPITDIIVATDKMIEKLKSKNKKILFAIDEVTNNKNIREFAAQYQIYLRKGYPVYFIMTGLYNNVTKIQNQDSMTFLLRTPKIVLSPLNTRLMAKEYKDLLHISEEESWEMAKLTKGYAYGYQLLGYLCWNKKKGYKDILDEFLAYLEEYVYNKIWSELSRTDKDILKAVASCDSESIKTIRESDSISSTKFNKYRERLLNRGILASSEYGHVSFALPMFKEFVLRH